MIYTFLFNFFDNEGEIRTVTFCANDLEGAKKLFDEWSVYEENMPEPYEIESIKLSYSKEDADRYGDWYGCSKDFVESTKLIDSFCIHTYGHEAEFDILSSIPLAANSEVCTSCYQDSPSGAVHVELNLIERKLIKTLNDVVVHEESFNSYAEMNEKLLKSCDYDNLVELTEDDLMKHPDKDYLFSLRMELYGGLEENACDNGEVKFNGDDLELPDGSIICFENGIFWVVRDGEEIFNSEDQAGPTLQSIVDNSLHVLEVEAEEEQEELKDGTFIFD